MPARARSRSDDHRYDPAIARLVVVLVSATSIPYEVAAAQEVFAVASLVTPRVEGPAYEVRTAGAEVDTPIGRLRPDVPLRRLDLAGVDTLVVPGTSDPHAPAPEDVLAVLRAAPGAARLRVVGLCTGSFLLAEAGLLAGRRATTHWRFAADLQRRHPDVHVVPDSLYVEDGPVLTSGGVTAAVDACLHLVRRDLGADAAARTARHLVAPMHREGRQRQVLELPVSLRADDDDGVTRAQAWMLARLGERFTVADVARHVHVSERTLHRRFLRRTGAPPTAWLIDQRLASAQRLLEAGALGVEQVARSTGFGTSANLRRHFVARMGTRPSEARRRGASGPAA